VNWKTAMNQTSHKSRFDNHDFKSQLEQRRAELLKVAERTTLEGRELGLDGPQDSADSSAMSVSKEWLFSESSRHRNSLRLIESALERIRDGSFGKCVTCEEEIGLRRLLALPWTQYCIECQQKIEQRSYGERAA